MYFISKKNISLDNRGFTLIEVMVSASIIALLAAIVFANVKTARVKAEEAKALQESKQVSTALELYSADVGNYPNSTTGDLSDLESILVPKYIFSVPESANLQSAVGCSNLGITYKSYNGYAQEPDEGNSFGEVAYRCGPGNSPNYEADKAVIFFPSTKTLNQSEMLYAARKSWWSTYPISGSITHVFYISKYFPQPDGTCLFAPIIKVSIDGNMRCISIGS